MSVLWEADDEGHGFISSLLAVVVVSAVISMSCTWAILRLSQSPIPTTNHSQITALKRKADGLEDGLRQQISQTSVLNQALGSLIEEDGILARLIGHVKELQERDLILSEVIMQQHPTIAASGGTFENGTVSHFQGTAPDEQNITSPTRLMVVTPEKTTKKEPDKKSVIPEQAEATKAGD